MQTLRRTLIFSLLAYCAFAAAQGNYEDRNWIGGISYCGCQECNKAAYNSMANGHTCGKRIWNLISEAGMTEEEACTQVGSTEFPSECKACDPSRCDGRGGDPRPLAVSEIVTPTATSTVFCERESCTQEIWDKLVGYPAYSCGARIDFVEKDRGIDRRTACSVIAKEQAGCNQCNPQTFGTGIQAAPEMRPAIEIVPVAAVESLTVATAKPPNTRCGCSRCTENILNSKIDGHSCGDRIDFLLGAYAHMYPREEDACRQVASVEYPDDCGPQCDPERCHGIPDNLVAANSVVGSANVPTKGRSRDLDLYCFPPIASRQTYENVWGKYTVQPKTDVGGGVCGPGDNIFSADSVSMDENGRDLKLQFKKVGQKWHGSEARILLPEEEMPYKYGSYTFSLKSIRVVNSKTGSLVSTVLPPSLVLGLFTWDPLEQYAVHENWNHEVDVEISRWGVPENADAQFLVQPPGDPQTHRFFTGVDGNSLQQAPRMYGFIWEPTKVAWYSNAGNGGQRFKYSTQDALNAGQEDYNQCMPSNVEVRVNLWNMHGSDSNPLEMEDDHVVEVVIDRFQFAKSSKTHVEDGAVCSKDCHCGGNSRCVQNQCTPNIRRNGGTRRRLEAPSDMQQVLEQSSLLTTPFVLLLVIVNLLLMLVVIRRQFLSPADRSGEIPSAVTSQDPQMSSLEKTVLKAHIAVVD